MKKVFIAILIFIFPVHMAHSYELVELPIKNSDKIVVKFMFRNGSISDPQGKEGLTSLVASLVIDGGTADKTSSEIKSLAYPMAARYYASVDKEVTVFTFEFHVDHADKFIGLLTQLITRPRMDEADFKRIKSNQANYVNQVIRSSSDEEFSKVGLENFYFKTTPYQHLVSGTTSGLESITLADAKQHFQKYFTSMNVMVGIAGRYSESHLEHILTAIKKDLPREQPKIIPVTPAKITDGIAVHIISKEKAGGSAIFTGSPLPINRSSDEFAALMIANSWLGEHRKSYSRLYQKIREQRSMNYGDYSYIEWYDNGGSNMLPQPGVPRTQNYFSVWIRPVQTAEALKKQYPELKDIRVGHAHFALRMAIRELNLLVENGLSKEDFELTRDFLKSYMKLYVQTPAKQLGFLMDSRFYGRTDYIAEMDKLLSNVTLEEVNNAIRKYWKDMPMTICVVTDESEAGPLKESLLKNSPSPMSYSNALRESLPKSILEEDEVVAVYPLNVKSVEIISDKEMFR
jgi:zinc protease